MAPLVCVTGSDPPAGAFVHVVATPDGVRCRGRSVATLGGPGTAEIGAVVAGWRLAGDTLVVTNDRYGAYPLFYWADRGELAVASRITDLVALGAPTTLDHDALAAFIRLGFFLADQTCFAAIRALPPATRLTWNGGELRIRSQPPAPEPVECGRPAVVDGFIERFRAAVDRRLPDEEYALPVSGGRDSRHILLELVRRQAPPMVCVSGAKFAPGDAGDAATAHRLAAALGLAHETVAGPRSRLAAELAANAAQSMTTVEGGWTLPLLTVLRTRTRLTYDGIGGDILTRRLVPRLAGGLRFDPGNPVATADRLLAAGRYDRYLPPLLRGTASAVLSRERAVATVAAELRRHAAAASPWTSFFFWNRTRRAIAQTPFGLWAGRPAVHAPFLDSDLFDFLMAVPDATVADGTLHDEAILRAYPHLTVPYATREGRHGLGFVAGRLAYLSDVVAYAGRGNRLLRRLLRGCHSGGGLRAANRLLPMVVYLHQLSELAPEARHLVSEKER